MIPPNHYLLGIPFGFLFILKIVNKEHYYNYTNYKIGPGIILDYLDELKIKEKLFDHNYGLALIAYIYWLSQKDYNHKIDLSYFEIISKDESKDLNEKRDALRIIELVNSFINTDRSHPWNALSMIKNRIEDIDYFKMQ